VGRIVLLVVALLGCAPQAEVHYDFTFAAARAARQTDVMGVELRHDDPNRPYVVLGDIQVAMRQQGSFGDAPDHDAVDDELRARAAKLGAHAIILVHYGRQGASWWSSNELRGSGRAVRYR
jgi:hypothetical protein